MPYRIVLKRSATKELAALPAKTHDNIIKHLRQLESNPRTIGAEKLAGIGAYKLRIGNYRIIYTVDDRSKEVEVVMVEDRKQVYQRLKRKK